MATSAQRHLRLTAAEPASILDEAARHLEVGQVRIQLAETFPLHEVATARHLIETGHMQGKIVLEMP